MSLGMTREQLVAYAKEVFESDKVARKDPIYGLPASSTELLLAMGVLEHLSNPPEVERGKWSMDVGLEMVRDAERCRALRDSGIAVSAWQDVGGVHWAVNGTEYLNLDDGADALLSRHQPQSGKE